MFTLSPQGRAVAAIVLAFTLLTGSLGRLGNALLAIFDFEYDSRGSLSLAALVMLAIAIGVALLSRSAAGADGWAAALGQGAFVLSRVGIVNSALFLLAVLIQGPSPSQAVYGFF